MILAALCLVLTVLAAVGLHRLAPRRDPSRYLRPALSTVVLLALPTVYVASIWSH